MLVRIITAVKRDGVTYELDQPVAGGGYLVKSIEFRQQGLSGINHIINGGANPTYLITTVSPLSDKEREFILIPADNASVKFVETEEKVKDERPELRKVD